VDKFAHLPLTLAVLLRKLADKRFSVRDASSERIDWVKAGCPIPELVEDDWYGLKESGPRPYKLPEGK
jgi:hypothetical protein